MGTLNSKRACYNSFKKICPPHFFKLSKCNMETIHSMVPIFVHRNLWRSVEFGSALKQLKWRHGRFVRVLLYRGCHVGAWLQPYSKVRFFAGCCICVRIGHLAFVHKTWIEQGDMDMTDRNKRRLEKIVRWEKFISSALLQMVFGLSN